MELLILLVGTLSLLNMLGKCTCSYRIRNKFRTIRTKLQSRDRVLSKVLEKANDKEGDTKAVMVFWDSLQG